MTKHTTMMTEETQLVPNSSQNSVRELSSLLMQRNRRILGAVVLCIAFFGVGLRIGTSTMDTIIIPHGDDDGVPASMMALQLASGSAASTAATMTSDDSCATEVPGAGPCCDDHPINDCSQVCAYLLMCDNGYVPEPFYTDDAHTQAPETSQYQPQNCNCRGYEDYNGCFCRQARDMIEHIVNYAGVGLCDPCPPPTLSPTHPPTTLLSEQTCKVAGGRYLDDRRRNVDTSKPFYLCFEIQEGVVPPKRRFVAPPRKELMLIPPTGGSLLDSSLQGGVGAAKIGAHCWTESIQIHGVNVGCYPSGYSEDNNIAWRGTSGRGNDNCGDPCTDFDEHYPFDYTCTVSKGVFSSVTQGARGYSCYQWKDTNKFCWTFQSLKGPTCEPLGFSSGGWDFSDGSDKNNCGPPCTEFDPI